MNTCGLKLNLYDFVTFTRLHYKYSRLIQNLIGDEGVMLWARIPNKMLKRILETHGIFKICIIKSMKGDLIPCPEMSTHLLVQTVGIVLALRYYSEKNTKEV